MINELVKKLENSLKEAINNNAPLTTKSSIKLEFRENRLANIGSAILGDIKLLQKRVSELPAEEKTLKIKKLAEQMTKSFETENKEELLTTLTEIKQNIPESVSVKEAKHNMPNMPAEIKSEVEADIQEIKKCYDSGCYRSAIVLCGRILETALHRKYYEATGQDILEKNPGIGLGSLIAKLNEKGVQLDPGLAQQIHLVNQVRIFSVHKKQRTFYPSQAQTNAIILFTTDTLEKLF